MNNYKSLIAKLEQRANPDARAYSEEAREKIASVSYSDALVYVRQAMMAVDAEYTSRTKEAGDKVKNHLSNGLVDVGYRFQGSVMTNTHIRGYSDIDLLAISDRSYSRDFSRINQIVETPSEREKYRTASVERLVEELSRGTYSGNSLDDLRKIRLDSETILSGIYNICDTTKAKAIRLTNQDLNREVEVVTANWYDSVSSVINGRGSFRGVQVYDKLAHSKCPADYPFLSIERINSKSSSTQGRLKRIIRFMKNCKSDSDQEIPLSSFDINAIAYDIEVEKYSTLPFYDLVPVICGQFHDLVTDAQKADNLTSIDGREYILRGHDEKKNALKILWIEIDAIAKDIARAAA